MPKNPILVTDDEPSAFVPLVRSLIGVGWPRPGRLDGEDLVDAQDKLAAVFQLDDQFPGLSIVLDAGPCGTSPTTIVDLTTPKPKILRAGAGDTAPFED